MYLLEFIMDKISKKLSELFRTKESFPQPEKFDEIRTKYVEKRSRSLLKDLQESQDSEVRIYFQELSPSRQEEITSLLSQTELGMLLLHKRMGHHYSQRDLVIERDEYPSAGPVCYVPEGTFPQISDQFLISLVGINEILKNPKVLEEIKMHWEVSNITKDDLFFLIGVEEAAHRMFFNKKNKQDVLSPSESPTYHSSDQEYRALLWKLEFVKLYFPQYLDAFKAFWEKNSLLRSTALSQSKVHRN